MTSDAIADTASMTNNKYVAIQGGGSTSMHRYNEVYIGGEAPSTSTVSMMVVALDSTVAATAIGAGTQNAKLALMDITATAPATAPVIAGTATTTPQRKATGHLLHLSLNSYGGIARWQARYGEEITTYSAAANLGELSVSMFTGGNTSTLTSGHVIFEVV
jgi:hypothetical protein